MSGERMRTKPTADELERAQVSEEVFKHVRDFYSDLCRHWRHDATQHLQRALSLGRRGSEMRCKLQALNGSDFAPFGEVFEPPPVGQRRHLAASFQIWRSHAQLDCYINHREPTALPHSISVMERHAFSSQAFMPFQVSRYIVAACADVRDVAGPTLRSCRHSSPQETRPSTTAPASGIAR